MKSFGDKYGESVLVHVDGDTIRGKYKDDIISTPLSSLYEEGDKPFVRLDETTMLSRVKEAGEQSRENPENIKLTNRKHDLNIYFYQVDELTEQTPPQKDGATVSSGMEEVFALIKAQEESAAQEESPTPSQKRREF